MIRQTIAGILTRASDFVLRGRNRSMIIVGTDREDTVDSGYGAGGENDPDSAAIDIVAGFDADQENINYDTDNSRIYVAQKTNPDEYFDISVGNEVQGEPAIIQKSDHLYMKSRKKIKIVNDNVSINIDEDGNIEIEAQTKTEIKVGNSKIMISQNGDIELNAGQGINGKILTNLDQSVHIDPITGGQVLANFAAPPAVVQNNKVFVK